MRCRIARPVRSELTNWKNQYASDHHDLFSQDSKHGYESQESNVAIVIEDVEIERLAQSIAIARGVPVAEVVRERLALIADAAQ